MTTQSAITERISTGDSHIPVEMRQAQIKQEIRCRIEAMLRLARDLPADACQNAIRSGLTAIKQYCQTVEKTFIVVEQPITCGEFSLGGDQKDTAILFRGPSEDASVAICVTAKGSLLHRNASPWSICTHAGDINPVA